MVIFFPYFALLGLFDFHTGHVILMKKDEMSKRKGKIDKERNLLRKIKVNFSSRIIWIN